jgi:hypothetical protein
MKLYEEASWSSGLRIYVKTLYNLIEQEDIPGVSAKEPISSG